MNRRSLLRQAVLAQVLSLLAAGCARGMTELVPPGDGITTLPAGWSTIEPGGDTVCARGAPFRFFVRPGEVNRLLVELRGGGACWNEATCSRAGSLFQEEASPDSWVVSEASARDAGIYDHRRDDNPFKDWHHVYIPYCTGDIHWGNHEATYGEGPDSVTIRHRGAVNVQAVLSWVFENVSAPEKVMAAGCSAGGHRHCILGSRDLYTLETDGVKLVDWIGRIIDGEAPPEVACEGAACGEPK